MSSSASRGGAGERMVHQDFIARIRFSNALPPPVHPPKLLEIPNIGLASGQYTTPGFASRLAREQPLNIEADAELGMPLDLVGMPGIFDGDESSIQAPSQAPQVHPHDRPLLKPLSTLGKPKVSESAVSFLRRTEYISSVNTKSLKAGDPFLPSPKNQLKKPEKRKSPEPDAGTPAFVKRKIQKSFDVASSNLKDFSRIKHPTKRNVKVVEALPLLPDLDSFPDSGTYVTIKFAHNPVVASSTYDKRLLSSVLVPIERTPAEEAAHNAQMEAHALAPEQNPKPSNAMNYHFFLADSLKTATQFKRKFDIDNPDREDTNLYTAGQDDERCFSWERIRSYETIEEKELAHDTKYTEEILLSLTDDTAAAGPIAGGPRAMLYYPVMQRSVMRSHRTKNIARNIGYGTQEDAEEVPDQLDIRVSDPTEEMIKFAAEIKSNPLDFDASAEGVEQEQGNDDDDGRYERAENGRDGEGEADEDVVPTQNGDGMSDDEGSPNGMRDGEQDAEGDEEE